MKSKDDLQMQLDLYLQRRPATIMASGRTKPSKYVYLDIETDALLWVKQMRNNKQIARKADTRVFYDLLKGGYYGPRN